MNELIKHIEGINAKTQKWIDEDPTNRWAGMITTDPKHWEEYGITTPLEYDKYMLAETIADASKSAYGSKFRVDPDEHTLEELQEMADRYCQAASEEYEREQKFYAEQVEAFKYLVQKTIDLDELLKHVDGTAAILTRGKQQKPLNNRQRDCVEEEFKQLQNFVTLQMKDMFNYRVSTSISLSQAALAKDSVAVSDQGEKS